MQISPVDFFHFCRSCFVSILVHFSIWSRHLFIFKFYQFLIHSIFFVFSFLDSIIYYYYYWNCYFAYCIRTVLVRAPHTYTVHSILFRKYLYINYNRGVIVHRLSGDLFWKRFSFPFCDHRFLFRILIFFFFYRF